METPTHDQQALIERYAQRGELRRQLTEMNARLLGFNSAQRETMDMKAGTLTVIPHHAPSEAEAQQLRERVQALNAEIDRLSTEIDQMTV